MSAVLNNVRDLTSPMESLMRLARTDAAHKARQTRLAQITQANELRLRHGIRTKQELQRCLENIVASTASKPGEALHDWRQMVVGILSEMEDGGGADALEAV